MEAFRIDFKLFGAEIPFCFVCVLYTHFSEAYGSAILPVYEYNLEV